MSKCQFATCDGIRSTWLLPRKVKGVALLVFIICIMIMMPGINGISIAFFSRRRTCSLLRLHFHSFLATRQKQDLAFDD